MLKAALSILLLAGTAAAETIQGTVLEDQSSAPITAASVKLKSMAGTTLKEMDTDRAGRFAVTNLPAGEYLVSVSKSNYATVNARMTAQADTAPAPIIRLIKYGVISGHLTSPRTGGSVSVVELVPEGQIPRSYSGTVDANGSFRIFGIPPGRYQLTAPLIAATSPEPLRGMALYPSNTQPREFTFTGGEEYPIPEFTVPARGTSSISGKVMGPGTPQIFSLALVESDHPSVRLMGALTAEGGAFHFDNILPGAYDLYATGPVTPAPSFFARVHFVLNSQKVDNIELALKPGSTVEFALSARNTTATASPCSQDGVVTLQAVGMWGFVRDMKLTAPIAPATPARIENVAPGPFNVSVRSTGGNCIGVITDETVVFQPLSSIHGTAPRGNVVVLRDMTPGRESVQAIAGNPANEFRFDDLAPGQYCVETIPAADEVPHWSPESGCSNAIVELAAGESKGL